MRKSTIDQIHQLLEAGPDGKIPYDEVRERFERLDASKYGYSMPDWVPDFKAVHQLLFDALEVTCPYPSQILELGAGTGRITRLLLERFSDARVTAVDNSANMLTSIESFPEHLAKRIRTVEGDFFSDELMLPSGAFDAMLSVFAICHGRSNADYRRLYERTFDWLNPGGCFICFDHVAAATQPLNEVAFKEWAALLELHFDPETIDQIIISTIKEDYPRPLYEHLEFLDQAGFGQLDVLWKQGVFGVYFGIKPTG
jgi:tRNA (cmo5U34)-methyltransferase